MARNPRHRKVVWSEGMFLHPHHFQQADRYHEHRLNVRLRSIAPLHWGLVDLEINEEGLGNGAFMLLSCHGALADGTPIDIPEADPVPETRLLGEHFDPARGRLDVYLALPVERNGETTCSLEETEWDETRYSREFITAADETDSNSEQQIPTARKNFKLLFGVETLNDYECLKIAEVEQKSAGVFALNANYIPPCLTIAASPQLMRIVRRLRELLLAKSNALAEQIQQRTTQAQEINAAEIYNLLSLQTINQFIPEVNHFYQMRNGHPETLFRLLGRLAGALTPFSSDIRPVDLPEYRHENLADALGRLDEILQELLRALGTAPTKPPYISMSLTKTGDASYEATIDGYLFAPSYHFYLAARGGGDQQTLIGELPRRSKIASREEIKFILDRALRGVGLNYSASPPSALARRPGHAGRCYFTLDTRSDYWEDIKRSNTISIHIPASPRDVREINFDPTSIELELIAIDESSL
jgi:type VI secretion system protein ImpJ